MKFRNRAYILSVSTKSGKFITFDGTTDQHLRIKFSVTHYPGGLLSQAIIDIYNLSKKSEGILSEEYADITLQAGYRNNIGVTFFGQAVNYETRRDGADTFIRIYADSGVKYLDKPVKPRSFSKTIKVLDVINVLANQFEMPYVIHDQELLTEVKSSGYQISGTLRKEMIRISMDHGLEWYIENGNLIIKKLRTDIKGQTIVVSELENGLIGNPSITSAGIEFDTHLTNSIKLRRLINLKAKSPIIQFSGAFTVNQRQFIDRGVYQVNKILIEGDTHDDLWLSKFSCIIPASEVIN